MNDIRIKIKDYSSKGIAKLQRIFYKTEKPVYNVYKSHFFKHALVSYLTAPFKLGVTFKHNNTQYVLEIAKILDSMGYVVDVIDFRDSKKYDYKKYDLILGFGEPFNASYSQNAHATRVYYGTIMYPPAHNKVTIIRLKEFFKKHHVWLTESARLEDKMFSLQTQAVDAMVMYGNKTIQDSYREYFSGDIYKLHNINFVFRPSDVVMAVKKDWTQARNKFCMFPAAGMIHKGLDVVLELFSKHPDWELHLGAPLTREPRFFALYKEILALPNIHFYGFVDMTKPEYLKILNDCGFFISSSASEGCPTSVINACTNGKVIPIATNESGLEPSDYVIPLETISEASIEKAILLAQSYSDKELENRATLAHRYFSTAHSKESYNKELTAALKDILEKKTT